jgi:hypothetical protein
MRRLAAALLPLLLACGCASSSRSSSPCGPCSTGDGSIAAPRPSRVEALARQRVELARKRLLLARASFEHGTTGLDDLFAALRDVAFAARDSGFHGEALRTILTEYRDAVVALQALTRERMQKGAVTQEAMSRVETLVAEAQYWLAESTPGP